LLTKKEAVEMLNYKWQIELPKIGLPLFWSGNEGEAFYPLPLAKFFKDHVTD